MYSQIFDCCILHIKHKLNSLYGLFNHHKLLYVCYIDRQPISKHMCTHTCCMYTWVFQTKIICMFVTYTYYAYIYVWINQCSQVCASSH